MDVPHRSTICHNEEAVTFALLWLLNKFFLQPLSLNFFNLVKHHCMDSVKYLLTKLSPESARNRCI